MTERRPIVILHGWNSTSASFGRLARLLRAELHRANRTCKAGGEEAISWNEFSEEVEG